MYSEYVEYIDKLEEAVAGYEKSTERFAAIQAEITKTAELKKALYDKYHHKFVVIDNAEVRMYSASELEQIKQELLDTSILTVLKRFLGIGKKQDVIYAELMGKIKGLTVYLQTEQEKIKEELTADFKKMKEYASGMKADHEKTLKSSGYQSDDNWNTYLPDAEEKPVLYIGDVDILLESGRRNSEIVLGEILGDSYRNGFIKIPYTRDGSDPFQFYCEYSDEQTEARSNGLIRSIIYQQIRQMQDYGMELHLIDGEDTGKNFSELLGLKQIREDQVWELNAGVTKNIYKYAQIYLSSQDISQGLGELEQYIARVAEETAGFASVEEYNQSPRGKENGKIPMQMVVVQNFPSGFQDQDIEILNKLIKNGSQRGVSVMIQYDGKFRSYFREKVDEPTKNCLDAIILEPQGDRLMTKECSSAVRLRIMPVGKREYIQSLVDGKTSVKEIDNRFSSLLSLEGPFGTQDASGGLHIPFALDRKGKIQEFTLAQALNAHGLISGSSGSGKSSLLHLIIASVAMNYTPEDVEIWLADYKINEFSSYKYNTPPHIKFLGLSKSQDFTYALLDKIVGEYERRQDLLKQADEEMKQKGERANITSITDYRRYYGKDSLGRLLIIIDEFHVMAQQVSEEPKYREILENLLAEGRAVGITFLFSDQAVSVGLKGLTDKGRKQIRCRLALSNDMEEMKEMLQTRDSESIKPFMTMKMGECALITMENVRTEDGRLEERQKIERVKNIYIDGETRFTLCKNIREFYHKEDYFPVYMDETEVRMYDDRKIDQWNLQNLKRIDYSRQIYVYAGEAMNLTGCFAIPLLRRRGENIMCVGGEEEEQICIILSQIRSIQRIPEHKVIILSDPYCSLFTIYEDLLEEIREKDSAVEIYSEPEEICRQINILMAEAQNRHRESIMMVIWIGLDDMYEEFQTYPEENPFEKQANPAKEDKAGIDDILSEFDKKWDLLDSMMEEDEAVSREENRYKNTDTLQLDGEEENLYNAIDDIVKLIRIGPRNGVFHSIIYDNTYPLRNNRKIKAEDCRHKLAFAMGRDECGEYLGRTMLLEGMENQKGIAAYYDGKGKVKKFIPYYFREL